MKQNLFVVYHWITFVLTIFLKKFHEKSYSRFKVDFFCCWHFVTSSASGDGDRRRGTILSQQTTNVKKKKSKLKVEELFSANFFGKMEKQKVIQKWTTNNFYK